MIQKRDKNEIRRIRHERVRKKISGNAERPRFCVYRSLKNIYVQIIDDTKGVTLCQASTLDKEIKPQLESVDKKGAAKLVGKLAAERAAAKGISAVAFDRNGYLYHGRVKQLAEAAREGGLKF